MNTKLFTSEVKGLKSKNNNMLSSIFCFMKRGIVSRRGSGSKIAISNRLTYLLRSIQLLCAQSFFERSLEKTNTYMSCLFQKCKACKFGNANTLIILFLESSVSRNKTKKVSGERETNLSFFQSIVYDSTQLCPQNLRHSRYFCQDITKTNHLRTFAGHCSERVCGDKISVIAVRA